MDTVSLGQGSQQGRQVDRQRELQRVYRDAIAAGLGEEGARVAMAIAQTEGGLGGAVGDLDGGGSFGAFQLYAQGQLPNFARAMGISVEKAKQLLRNDPHAANEWAFKTYLGTAIRSGMQRGLKGPELATHAQRTGQVSVSPERAGANYQALFSERGGPKVQARVVAQEDTMDEATTILQRLEAKKGQATSKRVLNPKVKNPDAYDALNPRIDNPDPTYRHLFTDGTYVDIKAPKTGNYEVVGGTALKALSEPDKLRAADKPDVREIGGVPHERGTDGVYRPVRTDGSPAGADAKPKPVIRQGPDGYDYSIDPTTGQATRIEGMGGKPATASPKMHTIGRSVYRETPDGNLVKVHEEPRDAPQAPYRSAEQAEMDRLKLEQMRREALPAATQLIQDTYRAVGEIEGMLKSGQFGDPTTGEAIRKADMYRQATVRNLEAALRGTTVAAEETAKKAAERADRAQGEAILSQRLQTGAGLAQNLLGQASRVMMPKGQSSLGFDPGAAAWALTEKMGGGPEIGELAKSLMLGARGGQSPAGPIPDMASMSFGLPGQPMAPAGGPGPMGDTGMPLPPQPGPMPGPMGADPAPPGDHLWPVVQQPLEEDPMRPQGRPLSELLPLYARPGAMTAI